MPAASRQQTFARRVFRSHARGISHRGGRLPRIWARQRGRDEDPGQDGPVAVGAVALAGGVRAGLGLDPRRPRGHHRRRRRRAAAGSPDPRAHAVAARPDRIDLRGRRGHGRHRVRIPHRPLRPQEAVPGHARPVPGRDHADGLHVGLLHVRHLPLLHGRRHRRRVLGDQLRDRRDDPRTGARHGRPGDQRQLLAGHGGRRHRVDLPAEHVELRDRRRLADRVRDRRHARPGDPARPQVPPGEPAVADDARAGRRGRGHRLRASRNASTARPTSRWRNRRTRSRCASARTSDSAR